jgi:hypothetical protein
MLVVRKITAVILRIHSQYRKELLPGERRLHENTTRVILKIVLNFEVLEVRSKKLSHK